MNYRTRETTVRRTLLIRLLKSVKGAIKIEMYIYMYLLGLKPLCRIDTLKM